MEGNPAQGAQNHFYHKIYCFWVSKYLPHSHTDTHRGQHSVFDCSRGAQKCFINLQLLSIYWQHVAAASLQTQLQLGATNRQRWSRSKSRSQVGWQEEDKKVAREICLPALGQMCEEAAGQPELTHTHTQTQTQSRTSCGYPFFICGCLFEKCAQFTIEIAACAFG